VLKEIDVIFHKTQKQREEEERQKKGEGMSGGNDFKSGYAASCGGKQSADGNKVDRMLL
jgi:hypothetical protein